MSSILWSWALEHVHELCDVNMVAVELGHHLRLGCARRFAGAAALDALAREYLALCALLGHYTPALPVGPLIRIKP